MSRAATAAAAAAAAAASSVPGVLHISSTSACGPQQLPAAATSAPPITPTTPISTTVTVGGLCETAES